MFKILFALFALVAMAFAAPNPNPAVIASGVPVAYSGVYGAPAYTYGSPLAYSSLGAYPYGAAPVVYAG